MNYSLIWLPAALTAGGLPFTVEPGWETRGRGDMSAIRGVICHDTASNMKTPDEADVRLVIDGRPDLAGPLAHLVLNRAGVFHIIAAGHCNHAGPGSWQGVTTGNSSFIGIEAENNGTTDPWPPVQMTNYARGCAAILKHIGASEMWCAGHKEYALPKGRKIDPDFDMAAFRTQVAGFIRSQGATA